MTLLLDHAKLHLAMLGKRDKFCIFARNYATGAKETLWLTEGEVIPKVEDLNARGFTCWVSLNDKDADNIQGVKAFCVLWFDLDAKRPDTRAATDEERNEALARANRLLEHIERNFRAKGFIASSGNGFHLFFPVPKHLLLTPDQREGFNDKLRAFARAESHKVGAEIDSTYDLRRVTTLIGSMNLKLPDTPLKTSWDSTILKDGLESALLAVETAKAQNRGLVDAIISIEFKREEVKPIEPGKHEDFKALLGQDTKLKDLYEGNFKKYRREDGNPLYMSRSEAEMALIVKLDNYGFSDAEINDIMGGSAIGKWGESSDSYRKASLVRAREFVSKNKLTTPDFFYEQAAINLDHLAQVENPDIIGKWVTVEAVVSSSSVSYFIPSKMTLKAKKEDDSGNVQYATETREVSPQAKVNLAFFGVSEELLNQRLARLFGFSKGDKDYWIAVDGYRTIYSLRVRPPVFGLTEDKGKIVDEKGHEYKALDIFVISDKAIIFTPSSLVRLSGVVYPHPRTQKITLLATEIEFLDEVGRFDLDKIKALQEKLAPMSPNQRLCWVLDSFEAYSRIIKRRNVALAGLLAFYTPLSVTFDGETQRGFANVGITGDTTVAKTETIKKLIKLHRAGTIITAETASQVGLTGAAISIEKEGWLIDWGFLVLNDRKLLAIDGCQKLGGSNWAAMAESERSGKVVIAKAAKNSAYARTRQIKIANALNPEDNKYSTKPMASFLYKCQALTTIYDKTTIARIDLAVFACSNDVDVSAVNARVEKPHDPDLELLSEVLKWCWGGSVAVSFADEAITEILSQATALYTTFYSDEIPLVSIDMKWKLARLSAALACLTLSTEDFKAVTVTRDHVEIVAKFIEEEYAGAGLNVMAQSSKYEVITLEDLNEDIDSISAKTQISPHAIRDLIKFIALKGRTVRAEIKQKYGFSETKELNPLLAELSNRKYTKSGNGIYSTPKLNQAYKLLSQEGAK